MSTLDSNRGANGYTEAEFLKALYRDLSAPTGTIVATTTKNNSDTASAFTLDQGALVLLQPDTACYVRSVSATTGAVATTTGKLLAANQLYYMLLPPGYAYVAVVAVSGTSNVKVWQLAS